MKKLGFGLVSIGISAMSFAEVGIGVSVQEDDRTIYVPIDVSNSFRVEPVFGFVKRDEESIDSEIAAEGYEFGIGFFALSTIDEDLNLYFGARVTYISLDAELSAQFLTTERAVESEQDGYSFAPTLGFEYFLSKNVSLGGEVSFNYQDLDGEETNTTINTGGVTVTRSDISNKSTFTDTSLTVRFYF